MWISNLIKIKVRNFDRIDQGFRVPGSGFRVPGSGFRVPGCAADPPGGPNLTSHLNLSQLQKERRRSLAGARDDRYVVD